MGFYTDIEKSLFEAIEMEKGDISLTRKENMSAPTFIVSDNEKKLIDDMVALRRQRNLS